MPQIIKQPKTQIKVIPKDGEIEITLNINITFDGETTTVKSQSINTIEKEKDAEPMIPDFSSGAKLKFGIEK